MRKRFYYWLVNKVWHVPAGNIVPFPLKIIRWMLFPVEMLVATNNRFNYNAQYDTYTIDGVKFAGVVFAHIGRCAENGEAFRFMKMDNGIVSIQKVDV